MPQTGGQLSSLALVNGQLFQPLPGPIVNPAVPSVDNIGLYKRMNMDYLYEKLMECNQKNIQNTIKQLIQFVVERGETDNISVALIMFEN